jgi:sugar lactone lactonase YvrE
MPEIIVHELPDVIISADAQVGEGPVFDARTGRLVWVDISEGTIFENDLVSGEQARTKVDTMVGAIAPREAKDGFAVAVTEGFGFVTAGVLEIADATLPEPFRRMNDAKVDSRGRMWAGSTHMEFVPGIGVLHRWNGDEPSVTIADGFTLPNGLGWDVDDSLMYLVDSFAKTILAAPFRVDDGTIGEFRPIATIDVGLPDGLTVDTDGFIWVASWGGSQILRYSPSGRLVEIVPVPVPQPSSCAFGSDGTLYITSARAGLSDEALAAAPLSGSVFALSTNTHGVPVHPFGG